MNGLKNMTDRILADAREEAEAILAAAEADCQAISETYAARADAIRERLSLEAEAKGADMVAQAKSRAAMQKRNLLLQQQSDLLDGVFDGAREWVLSRPVEQYADVLGGLLSAALFEWVETQSRNRSLYGEEDEDEDADAPFEVILCKKDRDAVGDTVIAIARKKLAGKLPEADLKMLSLSKDTRPMDGGVILRKGALEMNCSFGTVFAQLRRELEGEVGRVLFEVRGSRI